LRSGLDPASRQRVQAVATPFACDDRAKVPPIEITAPEEAVHESVRGGGDDDAVRLGQGLEPGGHVRCLANSEPFVSPTAPDLAHHHGPRMDADPDGEPFA
jgi:hypothetical protein